MASNKMGTSDENSLPTPSDEDSLDAGTLDKWTQYHIERWLLETCQLSQDVVKKFAFNGIDKGKQLLALSPEVCDAMGISLIGHKLSIQTAVRDLQNDYDRRHKQIDEVSRSNQSSDNTNTSTTSSMMGSDTSDKDLIRGLAKTQTFQHLTNSLFNELRAIRTQLQDKVRRVANPSNPTDSYHVSRNITAIRNSVNQVVGRELLHDFEDIDDPLDFPKSHDDPQYEDIPDIGTISLKVSAFIQGAVGALFTGSTVSTFLDDTGGHAADGITSWYRLYEEIYVGMKETSKYGTTYMNAWNSDDQDRNAPPDQLLANRLANYRRYKHTLRVFPHCPSDMFYKTDTLKEMLAYITVQAMSNHANAAVREMAGQVIRTHIGGKLCVSANEMSWTDTVKQLHGVYEHDTERARREHGSLRGIVNKKQAQRGTVFATDANRSTNHRQGLTQDGQQATSPDPPTTGGRRRRKGAHRRNSPGKPQTTGTQIPTVPPLRPSGGQADSPDNPPDGTTPTCGRKSVKIVPPEGGPGTEPLSKLVSILKKRGTTLCTNHAPEDSALSAPPILESPVSEWSAMVDVDTECQDNSYVVDGCSNCHLRHRVLPGAPVYRLQEPIEINGDGKHFAHFCQDLEFELRSDSDTYMRYPTRVLICPTYIVQVISVQAFAADQFMHIQGKSSLLWRPDLDLVFPLDTVNGFPTLTTRTLPIDPDHYIELDHAYVAPCAPATQPVTHPLEHVSHSIDSAGPIAHPVCSNPVRDVVTTTPQSGIPSDLFVCTTTTVVPHSNVTSDPAPDNPATAGASPAADHDITAIADLSLGNTLTHTGNLPSTRLMTPVSGTRDPSTYAPEAMPGQSVEPPSAARIPVHMPGVWDPGGPPGGPSDHHSHRLSRSTADTDRAGGQQPGTRPELECIPDKVSRRPERVIPAEGKNPPLTKMTLMQAHRMMGHCRDVKAIRTYCEANGITLTDNKWEQCVSCDANNLKDSPHTGTINRDPDAWSVDFKINGAPKDLCNFGNTNLKSTLKHLAIDISQARGFQRIGEVIYLKIDTEINWSDLMTKILDVARTRLLCLGMVTDIAAILTNDVPGGMLANH